ncbi:unnamed protein product [Cylicocyclus nassatus]|uniref:Uncharacterized protein n=1 Tax=Cylicocyclus nassatus TaxID=53992 RepID=A0AA36GSP8_CYLNA|nr:unnamed protein product [Cylicocyclus nassatus]
MVELHGGLPAQVYVRWIVSRGNDRDFEHHTRSEHEKESLSSGQDEGTPNPKEANKDKPKVDPALKCNCEFRQGIDMKSFVNKYLEAGEVRRIIFCPDYSRAVAFLYEGAIIVGRKVATRRIRRDPFKRSTEITANESEPEEVLTVIQLLLEPRLPIREYNDRH